MSRTLLAALAALAATPALAQTSAAPAPQAISGGPLIPGVCLLSKEAVISNAKVGQAASVRLKQLSDEAQAEVSAERAPIEAEAQVLQSQAATLKPEELQPRRAALQGRANALQQKAELRSREIEATRDKVLTQIAQQAQPLIQAAYTAHNCGLLVDRNSVYGGNMGGDLTADVVKALDGKITTISFNRETLGQAAPVAAAPRPIATVPAKKK